MIASVAIYYAKGSKLDTMSLGNPALWFVRDCTCIPSVHVFVSCMQFYVIGYSEFRALLAAKAKALDDSVLCSLDLLLPRSGGWSRSHHIQNEETRDFLAKAGIVFSIDSGDEYIKTYLSYLKSRGLLE